MLGFALAVKGVGNEVVVPELEDNDSTNDLQDSGLAEDVFPWFEVGTFFVIFFVATAWFSVRKRSNNG
jgi:hypothetical protein